MKIGDLGIHEQAVRVRNQRSEILAANIANAETPNYKARDFDFASVLKKQQVQQVTMKATQPGHIQPSKSFVPNAQMLYRVPAQPSLDGNTVDMQKEQVEFATNAMQYEASLNFLSGKINAMKKAFKGGS